MLLYLAPEDLHRLWCQGHQAPPEQDILQCYLHVKRLRHRSGIARVSQQMEVVRRLIGTLTPACIRGAKSGMCSCSKPHTCIFPAKEGSKSPASAEAATCCKIRSYGGHAYRCNNVSDMCSANRGTPSVMYSFRHRALPLLPSYLQCRPPFSLTVCRKTTGLHLHDLCECRQNAQAM